MEERLLDVYDLVDIMHQGKIFQTTLAIQSALREDFTCRKKMVTVRISNGEELQMRIGRLFINLFFIEPLKVLSTYGGTVKITRDDLFLDDFVTEGSLEKHFNKLIDKAKEADISGMHLFNDDSEYLADMKTKIAEIINSFSEMSGEFNVTYGNSLSLLGFIQMSEDPEGRELFYQTIDEGVQFRDIEDKFNDLSKKIVKYFETHPEGELHSFIVSKSGINNKQLCQALGMIGLKPDIDGNVIPVAIDTNYLVGLDNTENYFINCRGTRKAL